MARSMASDRRYRSLPELRAVPKTSSPWRSMVGKAQALGSGPIPGQKTKRLLPLAHSLEERIDKLIEASIVPHKIEAEKTPLPVIAPGSRGPGTMQKKLIEQRFQQTSSKYKSRLDQLVAEFKQSNVQIVNQFKETWTAGRSRLEEILALIDTDKLSRLVADDFEHLKKLSHELSGHRQAMIEILENNFDSFRRTFTEKSSKLLLEYGNELHKIYYQVPSLVARIVQEETILADSRLLETSETMLKYVTVMRSINVDIDRQFSDILLECKEAWKNMRVKFLFEQHFECVRTLQDIDFDKFYGHAQAFMSQQFDQQKELLNRIAETAAENLTLEWVNTWRASNLGTYHKIEDSARLFQHNVGHMEQTIEKSCQESMKKHKKLIVSCGIESTTELESRLEEPVKKFKKTSQFLAGKRAAMMLISQAGRNRDVLMVVADIMACILSIKGEQKAKLVTLEDEIQSRLRDMHGIYVCDYRWFEKQLFHEVERMKKEDSEIGVYQRLMNANKLLDSIEEAQRGFHSRGVIVIHTLLENVQRLFTKFRDQMSAFLDVVPYLEESSSGLQSKGNKGKVSFNDDAGSKVKAPVKSPVNTSGITFTTPRGHVYTIPTVDNEIEFFYKKVKSWRDDQAARLLAPAHLAKSTDVHVAGRGEGKQQDQNADRPGNMDLEKAFPSLDAEAFLADDAAYYPTDSDAVGNIGIIDSTACPPAVDLEHEKLVVEVPQLPSSSLVDVRVYIQKTYMQMVDTWEMQVEKQVSSRIQEKVGQLTNELHATLYRYENRRRDVEDQYRNRLEEIGLRAVLNEKEAFIIEHRIEQLKLSFTSSIDRLELLSREFTVSVTLPTIEQLRRIKKSTQMQSARALFNEKLEAHTKFMKESLSSALSTFQYGCDVLKKSRCEQHIQAWRIINQRHPKTDLIYELEAWVSTHDGRIDRVQKEVEAHAIRMEDEVWSHSEEVRFLEAIDDVLSKTKLRLRAEMAYMGQLDMIIHQKLDLLKFLANKENFNWDSVCQLLCTLNELRILIVNMTRYSNSLTESFDPSRVQVPVTLEKTKWMSSGSEFFLLSHPSVKKIITHDTYVGQALTLTQTILSDSLHEIKPTYQERVQLIWDETSASVELKSQEFYSSLRHTIKRTQEIPPTFPEYKKTLDGRMQGLKDDSESRRLDFSKGLLAIVVQYFDIISHSSEHILSSLYKDASFVCEDTWQQESQSFADAWKSEARRRKALYSSMKPRLGHPNNKSELDVFECSAEKLKKDFEGRIVKVRSSYEAALDKIRVQYLVEMEYLKTSFLALMSASVHSNDLIIPGDPPAVPKQTIRSIINARRAKKSLDELPLRSAAASTAVIASDTTERTKSVVSRFAQVHQDFSNRFSQDIRRRQLHVQSQAEEQKARNDLWFANWRDSILQILQLFDPNKSL